MGKRKLRKRTFKKSVKRRYSKKRRSNKRTKRQRGGGGEALNGGGKKTQAALNALDQRVRDIEVKETGLNGRVEELSKDINRNTDLIHNACSLGMFNDEVKRVNQMLAGHETSILANTDAISDLGKRLDTAEVELTSSEEFKTPRGRVSAGGTDDAAVAP
jgi:predicted  nucleic acid-binding Zn-ribbon protein